MLMAKIKKETAPDAELEDFKKKALEEAEKADGEDTEVESEEESEEEAEEEPKGKDSDKEYEEALAEERAKREKAEKALAERAFKERKKKREGEEEGEESEEDDKPMTATQLRAILAEERQATQKEIMSSQIKEKAKALATSEAEANLIMEIHKNRTFPSYLSIDEQLEESLAIANRKKLVAQNEELRRALRSKDTKKTDTTGTYKETPKVGEPKLAVQDKQALIRAGFNWDGKYYSKKMSNGKTLFKDWKTKKTFVK